MPSSWSSSACTAMCGSCGTSVATSRAVPRGSPRGLDWPAPTCTTTHSAWSRSGALVVRGHQPHRRRCVGPGAQGFGPRHIRVRFSVLAFREYVVEDVHEGRRRVVRCPLRGGGKAAPAAVAPDVKVQALLGHPSASVGVLLSPRGVDESQAGIPRASGVEDVDQGVRQPGVVGGLLLAAAIVEVFIGALLEAFPCRRRPRVVVLGEGVVWPVVRMPRRRVRHRQAARVAVS